VEPRDVTLDELRGVLWPPIIDLNRTVFGRLDGRVPFAEVLADHMRYPGFRALVVRHPDGRLAGYAYGYTSAPGQWWHDQVAAYLDPDAQRHWLSDCFEVASLGLLPEARGLGLGGRLLDRVLEGLPHRTAVLSVAKANEAGQRLYRGRGWRVIVEEFLFEAHPEPYLVMGLERRPFQDSR
jgi:ribosomal protein S18 acetylase RimI-like enzyme